MKGFPSPYGDMVLKWNIINAMQSEGYSFPSPYGDMVLK